jgi:UDP-N-acetyl-D-mannosaminuronic acid dehydrogenase
MIKKEKIITVVGLGYIGLPTSLAFSNSGFEVIGVDVNESVVQSLNSGQIHIEEEGLQEYFNAAFESKKFRATTKIEQADVFLIAVPTPFKPNKTADLDYVKSAAESIATVIQKSNMVILESTVPPGTCERIIAPIIEAQTGLKHGTDYDLVHCPERVIPGSILKEIIHNDRIIGGTTQQAALRAKEVYQSFVKGKILLTTAATAEITKLMENTYRDVNIALANELSLVCEQLNIDIQEAISLANHHPRVNIHQPGIGVGGHCIPVDPWFIAEISPEHTPLIQTARKINDSMPKVTALRIVKSIKAKSLNKVDIVVGILGLTYKPDVDDFRESPAIEVVHELLELGYNVKVHDPFIHAQVRLPEGAQVGSFEEIQECDVVKILVQHSVYQHSTNQKGI